MCGIAGLLLNAQPSIVGDERRARLDRMVDTLAHRGPDDRGTFVDGPVAIGMRRLSIIDTEGGHQPISNEDGTVWVVYNGECYNFQELTEELVAAGHTFRTRSDTETLVHGYEQWGIRGLVERLNGIFAFCIWDARDGAAYLVRDRLGVKPLYYVARNPGVAFSSELRSLVRSGLCLPKLDEEAVWSYLLYQYPPTERTPVSGAVRLPAGHLLEWRAETGSVRVERYWDLPEGGERDDLSFEEAAAGVADLLDDAVRRQMVSDVPIGCFLSGGLDSSVVAALIARHSSQPVRTFSIGFPAAGWYDETAHAEEVARLIGARHTTVAFEEDAFLEHIDDYLARVDEPVADAAMLPTYVLAERAAREVKVVLTGEGADEVFGGYDYYRRFVEPGPPPAGARRHRDRLLSDLRLRLEERLGRPFPPPERDLTSPASGFPYTVSPEFVWCMLETDRRPSLETFRAALARVEGDLLPATVGHTPLQRALYVDTKLWLGHDLMTKLDKATMAHSLEGRVPLLDHRLVEYAFRLPDRFKVGREHGKLVMREAVRRLLPADVVEREKHGFGVPIAAWFRGRLRDYVAELLLHSSLVAEGLLTREGVEAVLASHLELEVDMARLIWALANLERWWRAIRDEIVEALPSEGAIPARRDRPPTVDILIPVYEGFSLVRDCVRSIRAFTEMPFRAILLDDAGSEATHRKLAELVAGDPRFELVRNPENLGFVENCNRGMAMATADYVVLLNSDTAVAPGWLERMVACAESDPRIAVVNPLTNESGNTSIRLAPGLNLLTMAERVAELSRRDYPDLTTAVGMCMLVRRSALDLLGRFDPVYGNAYCEESDLCMRFTEAGLRAVAADDAFIYHKGWASYDEEKKNLYYIRNRATFDARWSVPFDRDWRAYSAHDPLQYMRDALLRFTVSERDVALERHGVVAARQRRLTTSRTLRAMGNGRLTSAAAALVPERAPVDGALEFREWGVERKASPPLTFEDRGVFFPTRDYVATLPRLGDDRLRVTFLVASLPLAGGIISIVQLARELLLAGHDVRVVTEARECVPERLNLWAQPLVYRNRRHLVEEFPESDVVVATFWVTAHAYMRALRERYDFTSVYFIQDYESWFYPEHDVLSRENVIHSYRTTEHHIVKSRWLADMVARHGPRCEIVPLGLDLGVFYPRGRPRSERPRVVAVAKPGPEGARRGFADTVEAFRRVCEARPDVEIVFYGTEPAAMPDLPFEHTNAGPLFDQNRVAELLSSADVLLDASLWQGFGRPGLEAMACGAVPVLTRIGGLTEYARDEENCLLVSPQDPAAAAEAILRLLADPGLRERLAEGGRATAARFSHEVEAERHVELYRRWVAERRAE